MKIATALLMGACSGALISAIDTTLFGEFPAPIAFICGWTATSFLLLRNAQTTAKVAARGFLVGAVEWLLVIAVMILAGFIRGMGFGFVFRAIIFLFMAGLCLIGWAIAHTRGKPEPKDLPFSQSRL